MKRRRSKLEVYLDVLWIIKKGTKKPTRIMYEANLSWKPLQNTLKSLINEGLIKEFIPKKLRDKRTNVCYMLTQKGENVLKYFNQAKKLFKIPLAAKIRF